MSIKSKISFLFEKSLIDLVLKVIIRNILGRVEEGSCFNTVQASMWQTSRVCLVLLFLDLCNVQRLVNVYWLWQSIGFVLGFCNYGVAVLRTQYPFVSPSRTSFVVGTFSEEYHLASVISHISSNESANFCTLIPLFLLQMLVDVYGMVSCIPFYS